MSQDPAWLAEARDLAAGGRHEAALARLAPRLEPLVHFTEAHALYLDLLLTEGRRAEAGRAFEDWTSRYATSVPSIEGLAFYARRLGRHEQSRTLYARAVADRPHDARLWYNLAASERTIGRLTAAVEACERTLGLDPGMAPALLLRSELVKAQPGASNVDALRKVLRSSPDDRLTMFAAYALGKELQDLGEWDGALDAFALGARVRRRNLAYDVAEDEVKMARIREVYPVAPDLGPGSAGMGSRHIFIIGLPRSGTTLTERILGALPGVVSNGETNNLSTALLASAAQGPGDIFDRCARADSSEVGRRYDALASDGVDASRIIEKLPLNYLYVGAIAQALPGAAIVRVRRHPVDSCFAMFRTLFGEGYPFSYDFDDLARYYAAYARLMEHWSWRHPGRMIDLDYEALVASPAEAAAGLADRCSLDWTEAALDLSRNTAPSLTASAAQVRGHIYGDSSGLWRRYGHRLDPLVRSLERQGVDL